MWKITDQAARLLVRDIFGIAKPKGKDDLAPSADDPPWPDVRVVVIVNKRSGSRAVRVRLPAFSTIESDPTQTQHVSSREPGSSEGKVARPRPQCGRLLFWEAPTGVCLDSTNH